MFYYFHRLTVARKPTLLLLPSWSSPEEYGRRGRGPERDMRAAGLSIQVLSPYCRDVQPGALVVIIARHYFTERDSAPAQYNGIV